MLLYEYCCLAVLSSLLCCYRSCFVYIPLLWLLSSSFRVYMLGTVQLYMF